MKTQLITGISHFPVMLIVIQMYLIEGGLFVSAFGADTQGNAFSNTKK